jgi:hypothetical protein
MTAEQLVIEKKIRPENVDIFKNRWEKGVANFYLYNGINKSIANFRETIPLSKDVPGESGVGVREIFSMVWVSIEIICLSRGLTVYNFRHPRHEAF